MPVPEMKILQLETANRKPARRNRELAASSKALTEKLRETEEALQHLALTNAKLAGACDNALRANGAQNKFIARISHEIRTPMTGLLGARAPRPGTHGRGDDLDGIEATRKIRELERKTGGEVPIYGITAHVLDEDVARCLLAGMNGHLSKPVEIPEILEILDSHRSTGPHCCAGPEGTGGNRQANASAGSAVQGVWEEDIV